MKALIAFFCTTFTFAALANESLEAYTNVLGPIISEDVRVADVRAGIGYGWDSLVGETRKSCVELKKGRKLPVRTTNITEAVRFQSVLDASEIIQRYTSSAKATYSSVDGSSKGSVSSREAWEGKFSNYSTYAIFSNTAEYSYDKTMDIDDFELKKDVVAYLKEPGGIARFQFECGDQFMTDIIEGGKLEAGS